jgi:hypothetical protein
MKTKPIVPFWQMPNIRNKAETNQASEQYKFHKHNDRQESSDKLLLIRSRVHTQCTVKLNPITFERVRALRYDNYSDWPSTKEYLKMKTSDFYKHGKIREVPNQIQNYYKHN